MTQMARAILQDQSFDEGDGHLPIHQQRIWTQLNAPGRKQRYTHFQVREGDRVLSQGLMRFRRLLPGVSFAAIQRGPATRDLAHLEQVLPALEQAAARRGAVGLTINPYLLGPDVAQGSDLLLAQGYERVSRDLQNFPTTTAMIDLTCDDDTLMAAMTQTGRRHLRKALKAGVTCRPMETRAEAALANEIMAKMAVETGLVTDSQHDFIPHFDYLSQNPDRGSCLVTCLEGEIFGAAVNYAEGDLGYNMLIATRSDVTVPRAYALMWDSLRSLRAAGCTRFDMVGYPDPEIDTDEGAAGRGAFKRSFGPEIVPVLPLYAKPLRPVLHGVMQRMRARHRKTREAV